MEGAVLHGKPFLLIQLLISAVISRCLYSRCSGAENATAGSSNQGNIIDGSSSYLAAPSGAHSYHHSQGSICHAGNLERYSRGWRLFQPPVFESIRISFSFQMRRAILPHRMELVTLRIPMAITRYVVVTYLSTRKWKKFVSVLWLIRCCDVLSCLF